MKIAMRLTVDGMIGTLRRMAHQALEEKARRRSSRARHTRPQGPNEKPAREVSNEPRGA